MLCDGGHGLFLVAADAREGGREVATDNAVSALGSLLEALRDRLSAPGSGAGGEDGVGRAWSVWLEYMPLEADEEEAVKVWTSLGVFERDVGEL